MTGFVDDYVRQVEAACADLPAAQRRRLVADLAAHLHEIDTATGSVYAELGPPEQYARELREALDLPAALEVGSTEFGPPRLIVAAGPATRRGVSPGVVLALVCAVLVVLASILLAV